MNANVKPASDRTPEEIRARKIKIAETGIVFAIVLCGCLYLGVRLARQPLADHPADHAAARTVPAEAIGAGPAAADPPDQEPEMAAPRPTPAASASSGLPEALPEEPVFVTYGSAEKAFFEGRHDEAAAMFATYCQQHPANTWGHYMRGLSLWKAGRAAEARTALTAALDLQPDHLKSLVNLARVELDLAEPEAALATIERALDAAPRNVEALRVLGRAYHELERPDAAAAAYLQALRLQPDDAWSLNNLGLIHIEREEFEQALPPLARACELAPEVAVIRNNLGTALERTGHPGQALQQYELAAGLGSPHAEENLVRLAAVDLPADAAAADLAVLAASWQVPEAAGEAVAALAPSGEVVTDGP